MRGNNVTYRIVLFLFLLASAANAGAQSTFMDELESVVEDKGRITVERDSRLDSLIGVCAQQISGEQIKATGYRIQVYAGNNTREAKVKAQEAESMVRASFPEQPVYTVFKSPRWLCTVGDFLYYEDAYNVMREMKKKLPYKGMLILRNQEINISVQ